MNLESFTQILPQLGTGVVAILVLGAAIYFFVKYLQARDVQLVAQHNFHMQQMETMSRAHLKQLDEREEHSRTLERDFRSIITEQLSKNTQAVSQSSDIISKAMKTMDRMFEHMDQFAKKTRKK